MTDNTIAFQDNGYNAVLTIHNDGRIELSDHAQPTEAAALCIEAMSGLIQGMIQRARDESADRIEELDRYLTMSGKVSKALSERIETLEAENARFRKALEFYADDQPFGNEARKALGVK